MISVAIYTVGRFAHQRLFHDAMAEGMQRHGLRPRTLPAGMFIETDVAVVWGEHVRKQAAPFARDVLVMERGYFHDRQLWTSVGWNGLNGLADFRNQHITSDERRRKIGLELMRKRDGGDCVLLIGQVPGDFSHRHVNIERWYADAAQKLGAFGLPVVYRPHPLGSGSIPTSLVDMSPSIYNGLSRAVACVTFSSNAGVDAVLADCPVVAADPRSMVYGIAQHDLDRLPQKLDSEARQLWANRLAWCQWTEKEIRSGDAWAHVSRGTHQA